MIQYSIGVRLAWEIASYEAKNKNSALIEIDHIVIGILSLEKIIDQIRLKSEVEYKSLFTEKENLYKVLFCFRLDSTTIRRKLRKMLPVGNGLPSDNIYHRSNSCKEVFQLASNYSIQILTIKYIFLSALSNQNTYISKLLLTEGIETEKLKTELMFSEYKKN